MGDGVRGKGVHGEINLFHHKRMPIPLGLSDGYLIVWGEFLIEGNYLPSEHGCWTFSHFNPLRPTVIPKLLEIIGRVRLCPSCSFATALDSDINQTTGSGGHLSM